MSDLPAEIGRYRIERVLGQGGMGAVYKAHDPDIDRSVALKLIHADLLSGEERADYIARFRREAQAAGRCMHPNIVAIYDFALHDGNPFLAMEYVEGTSLSQILAAGTRFGAADAVAVVLQILDALDSAHRAGIVHRDIKPANILLVGGARVKVTDFGISRFESSDLTQKGSVVGTPSYMSPEQCRGDSVDARSDLFSTGAVLYEMLSGRRCFSGATMSEIVYKLMNEPAPTLSLAGGAETDALQSVLDRALAKTTDARFATAADMANALRAALPAASASQNDDMTVIAPTGRRPYPESGPTGGFVVEPEALSAIERRLAVHIGPIAKLLVQTAARGAQSIDGFYDALAAKIDSPNARAQFLRELQRPITTGTGSGTAAASRKDRVTLSAEVIAQIERDLTRHLGPIAKILVKRAAPAASSPEELRQLLAEEIEAPAARAAFLAGR